MDKISYSFYKVGEDYGEQKDLEQAISCVSPKVRSLLLNLPQEIKENTQEIRLRSDRPITIVGNYGCRFINQTGRVSYICTQNSAIISSGEITDTLIEYVAILFIAIKTTY